MRELQLSGFLEWELDGRPVTTIRALMDRLKIKRGSLLNALQNGGGILDEDYVVLKDGVNAFLDSNREAGRPLPLNKDRLSWLTILFETGVRKIIEYIRKNPELRAYRQARQEIDALLQGQSVSVKEPVPERAVPQEQPVWKGDAMKWYREARLKARTVNTALRLYGSSDSDKARRGVVLPLEEAVTSLLVHVRSISRGGR